MASAASIKWLLLVPLILGGWLSREAPHHAPPSRAAPVVRMLAHSPVVTEYRRAARRVTARHLAGPYAHAALRAARKNHLPPLLVAAVIHQENRGFLENCAERVSPAGAIGPMQLMPATAWNLLHVNPWNPKANIAGGAKYLRYLVTEFHSVSRALVAYNAGPTQVAAGVYPEQAVYYARAVMRNAGITPYRA